MTNGCKYLRQRKGWPRIALLTLLLLFSGAVVNVAVAWACVVWAPWPKSLPEYRGRWPLPPPAAWPDEASVEAGTSIGLSEAQAWSWERGEHFMAGGLQLSLRAGLPARALGRAIHIPGSGGKYLTNYLTSGGPRTWREGWLPEWLVRTDPWAPYRVLPLVPVWPGFAVNTVFYAALLWSAIRGPTVVRGWRRWWRRRRGLCVACGYDLRGSSAASSACPECGEQLRGLTP